MALLEQQLSAAREGERTVQAELVAARERERTVQAELVAEREAAREARERERTVQAELAALRAQFHLLSSPSLSAVAVGPPEAVPPASASASALQQAALVMALEAQLAAAVQLSVGGLPPAPAAASSSQPSNTGGSTSGGGSEASSSTATSRGRRSGISRYASRVGERPPLPPAPPLPSPSLALAPFNVSPYSPFPPPRFSTVNEVVEFSSIGRDEARHVLAAVTGGVGLLVDETQAEAANALSASREALEALERRVQPPAGVDVGGAPGPSLPSPVFTPLPFAWRPHPQHSEGDNTDPFFIWMAEQMRLLLVPWGPGGFVLSIARHYPALVVDCDQHRYAGFSDGMVYKVGIDVGKEGQNIIVAVELKTAKRFRINAAACEAQAVLQLLSLVGGRADTPSAHPPLVFLTTGEVMSSRLLYSRGQDVVMSDVLPLDAALLRVAAHIVASSGEAGEALASAPTATPPVAVAAGPSAAAPPALSAPVVPSPPLPQPPASADQLAPGGIPEPAAQVLGAAASCQWAAQAWEPIVESAPSVDYADEVAAVEGGEEEEVWLALEEVEEVDEEDSDEEEEEEMTVEVSFLSLLYPQSCVAACSGCLGSPFFDAMPI